MSFPMKLCLSILIKVKQKLWQTYWLSNRYLGISWQVKSSSINARSRNVISTIHSLDLKLLNMCRMSLIFSFQSIATSFTVSGLEIVVCLFNAFYSCRFQEILDLKLSWLWYIYPGIGGFNSIIMFQTICYNFGDRIFGAYIILTMPHLIKDIHNHFLKNFLSKKMTLKSSVKFFPSIY